MNQIRTSQKSPCAQPFNKINATLAGERVSKNLSRRRKDYEAMKDKEGCKRPGSQKK